MRRRWLPLGILTVAFSLLAGCTPQQAIDFALAPPESTPQTTNVVVLNTPLPTATPVVIQPRPLVVNVARLSVKPGDDQEIDIAGTPQEFINLIVSFSNGDFHNDATVLGAQLDLNGSLVRRWAIDPNAPGGPVSVVVQEVKSGHVDHESFQIDGKPWGGPAPSGPAPVIALVPYGTRTPGAAVVEQVTPAPNTPTPFPFLLPTPAGTANTTQGPLQVNAYPTNATVAVGGTVRINGVLADASGHGVAGARLFAIAHYPSGHSEVWVSPAESGNNGLVWVSSTLSGVSPGAAILVDVYMTYNGQAYHGQTSFNVR